MPGRKPRFITRNIPSKCVLARIRRGDQSLEQYFYLSDFGSWKAAEDAAKQWVEEALPNMPDPIPIKDRMTKRNTSGVVGVRLTESIRRKNGNEYRHWRWIAFWPECPFPGGIGWSVNKYGEDQAFMHAVIARKLETIDREIIDAEYSKLQGTKEFKRLLELKRIEPA